MKESLPQFFFWTGVIRTYYSEGETENFDWIMYTLSQDDELKEFLPVFWLANWDLKNQ